MSEDLFPRKCIALTATQVRTRVWLELVNIFGVHTHVAKLKDSRAHFDPLVDPMRFGGANALSAQGRTERRGSQSLFPVTNSPTQLLHAFGRAGLALLHQLPLER
mmetsp:Transcript_3325/g.10148  ORF Transcript_3325/g.10148 Transcript_3325/m.10148 type:complete len:105 (+) Transcript_3325:225-539(+)